MVHDCRCRYITLDVMDTFMSEHQEERHLLTEMLSAQGLDPEAEAEQQEEDTEGFLDS